MRMCDSNINSKASLGFRAKNKEWLSLPRKRLECKVQNEQLKTENGSCDTKRKGNAEYTRGKKKKDDVDGSSVQKARHNRNTHTTETGRATQ